MGVDLAAFLSAYAVVLTGDPLTLAWSIGGPFGSVLGLLGQPEGLSGSHNKYEGDSSVCRDDAYLNHGDATNLDINHFKELYDLDPSMVFCGYFYVVALTYLLYSAYEL